MQRRQFLEMGSRGVLAGLPLWAASLQPGAKPSQTETRRKPVLCRAGMTRLPGGKEDSTALQQTVVRASDSEGRLAAFVVPIGEHQVYRGAPLHLHHAQDEWIHVLAGEFVAEVGGQCTRLKPGDSLLMPMGVPHRWSVAQEAHCGAIHLYTPAGFMDLSWDPHLNEPEPKTLDERKALFEKYGMSLLGDSLTKEEIDRTV